MPERDDRLLVMRDFMDSQLETRDGRWIGRVDDVAAEWRADGSLVLTHLLTGPQALAGRISSRLRPVARLVLRDRFDHRIPIGDVAAPGPTLKLRRDASDYATGRPERWLADHVLRFIPGSRH